MDEPENTGPDSGGPRDTRFQPGKSGNPAGKPRGTKNRTTLALETMLDGEAENITRKAIELAKGGDLGAMRLCLERVIPARKDRHVTFTMPKIETAQDAAAAAAALLQAVSEGELTPSEATELGKLVESFVKALEATEFDERLRKLEGGR